MLWPAGGAQRPRRGRGAQRASSPQSQRRTRPRPLRVGARGLPRHRPAGPGCGAGDRGSLAHPPGPPGGAFRNRPGRGLGGVVLPDPGGADARRGGAALLAPGRRGVRGRGGRIMTTVKIRIPTPLRGYTTGRSEVEVAATTVGEALAALGAAHEGLLARILTPEGTQRQFVNLFVGERNVRELAGLATPLTTGDVIAISPAVAGGAPRARDRRLTELKAVIPEVEPREALALQARGAALIDVREADEIAQGSPTGALRLGRGF